MSALITCLCLTRNRREWLPHSIACFQRQSYPFRELLIVADRLEDVDGLVPADDRIRVLVTGPGKLVGTKRNLGCEAALGTFIAIWDDDDHSDPTRLEYQLARISGAGAASVTGFREMKFTDGPAGATNGQWWRYRGGSASVIATSMLFRRDWWAENRFQDRQCGQDELFISAAIRSKQLAVDPDLDLMYATAHAGNTSPRALSAVCYTRLSDFRWTPRNTPLTVIIPSRNDDNLAACAAAVRKAEPHAGIIAVDDGLRDPEISSLRAWIVPGQQPFVFARNINIGIRAAGDAADVVLLNDDALLETPGGFSAMQALADRHPEFGIIAAATDVTAYRDQRFQAHSESQRCARSTKEVAFVCVLIPRRTIERVGLLEERFAGRIDGELIYGGEDNDYCYRVRQAGLQVGRARWLLCESQHVAEHLPPRWPRSAHPRHPATIP